jgi:(R,R)-butanediol dehydrogenase/meso-butanediol dehydrogenase/diacetyl reductase
MTDEQAAMIEPAAVALYGVDRGGVEAGSTVLVSGAGPIGALTVLAANAAGAATIIVSEPNPNRRRIISEHGAIRTRRGSAKRAICRQVVGDLTEEGVGVDVALECVGLEASLNACADIGAPAGQGRPGRPAHEARERRRDALGAQGHHSRGDLVLSRRRSGRGSRG